MKFLDKKLQVKMPDGSLWAVPVRVIAEHRANYYVSFDCREDYDEVMAELDEYEAKERAANNMDWDDVANVAVCIKSSDFHYYQEGWVNGNKAIID